MLSLSAGSSCDVCYEGFGADRKAPCSIECGHIFCVECISNITHLCPLCRMPFDKNSCIRLHVDLDAIPPDQSAGCSPADMKEAQRLQKAIASIADQGTSEANLRSLIQEGRTFLHGQPRHLHKDLRVAHRMLAYLCEIKTDLRAQKQGAETLNNEIKQLATEKEELLSKLREEVETRRYERETALAVETSLREHCAGAVNNYNVLIKQFNILLASTKELIRPPPIPSSSSNAMDIGISESIAPTPDTRLLPGLDLEALDGAAIRDAESFLISPLPQFTSILPSVFDGFRPLPELTEDTEEDEDDRTTEDEEEVPTPDSARNQRSISGSLEPYGQLQGESLPPLRPEVNKVSEPSGLSRTSPYLGRRRRSSSSPTQPRSRSHSPFSASTSTTPPMPPPQHLMSSSQSHSSRYPQSARETYNSSPHNADGQVLRTRLHDLLRDSPTSSSLPNPSPSHFPASFTNRDRDAATAGNGRGVSPPPPSRTGSSNSGKVATPVPPPSSDGISHLLASGPHQHMTNKPAPTPSPNPMRYSSASAEAKKLEEERRRKYLEEKQQREQQREGRHREEGRYKEDRHREERDRYREDLRYAPPDYEKYPGEDREYRSRNSSRTSSSAAPSTTNPSSRWEQSTGNQKYRDVYSNPMTSTTPIPNGSSADSSSLKRGSSTNGSQSGTYGRSSAVPPVPSPIQEQAAGHHREQLRYTSGSKSRSNTMPSQLPSNPSGIYT